MVFIDVRRKIGAGEIGSANLAQSAAYTPKIGTFSLAKATGTLVNASIGSLNLMYGSSGTFAGPMHRGARAVFTTGSFMGTVYGRVGSFARTIAVGTLRVRSFGSVQGTVTAHAVAVRGIGSFQGTVYAHRVQAAGLGSFTGTVYGHYGTFGTVAARKVNAGAFGPANNARYFGIMGSFNRLNTGTMTARRVGSFQGTVFAHAGSFGHRVVAGTFIARSTGSFKGTVTAHRMFATSFPGTTTVRTAGTTHGWFAAPANARYITVSVQTAPSVTNPSGIILRQQTMGTIGQASSASSATVAPAETMNVSGWVLPGHGSYMVGTLAGPIPVIKFWREYDP